MSVKLVLLGMLKRGPQHGYELKSGIEREMGDWTSIAFGSIYFALKKLTEEGHVRQAGEEQEGHRPSRIIYEITPAGETEFGRLLLKAWTSSDRLYFPLDIGLYFSSELSSRQLIELLTEKITAARYAVDYLKKHRDSELADTGIPKNAAAIFSHSMHHLEAELAWLDETLRRVKDGEF